jgi:arylsulfatase A-like enzyme
LGLAYSDHEIGRIISTIEKLGQFDNTLIIFVAGDNGMSAEGSMNGTRNEVGYFNGFDYTVEQMLPLIPVWGTDLTYNHFAVPWAFAMDTPYRWVKQVASHLGGTRTGMVMTWPKRITDAGGIRNQFHHVIDIAPTILDAIGIPQPTMIDGIAQRPYDGVSKVSTWDKANCRCSIDAHHPIFRDLRQSRHRSRRLDGQHRAGGHPVGRRQGEASGGRHERLQMGIVQSPGRSHTDQRPGGQGTRAAAHDAGTLDHGSHP